MDERTDFLLLYDHTPPAHRPAMLDAFFAHHCDRVAFERCANDRLLRARVELACNLAVPYEDFLLLHAEGYARQGEEWRSLGKNNYGEWAPQIHQTDKQIFSKFTLLDRVSSFEFFAPFVEGYLCRDTGQGIVACREVLEVAFDIEDGNYLGRVVSADGKSAFLGDQFFHLDPDDDVDADPSDVLKRRREKVGWWSIEGRGVVINDLSRLKLSSLRGLRELGCDKPARAVFSGINR